MQPTAAPARAPLGLPGRLALAAALYALVVGGLTLVALVFADPYARWPRVLDLEDLFFTTPLAALAALVLGAVELARSRRLRGPLLFALVAALIGLGAFAFVLVALAGAAALLQNI